MRTASLSTSRKYQCGTVEIEDDVEFGALVAVDRALSGATRLSKGVKIDNFVQIAHNVEIGESTVIASQAGIAGSSAIGRYCVVAGTGWCERSCQQWVTESSGH